MPVHDQHCLSCAWADEIVVKPFECPPCPECGSATERYYPIGATTAGVIGDEFVGGRWVENLAPTPVYITSRSHLKREMAARGLEQKVRHVGVPGSDRSPQTQRWV